jgi:hypothetical protein
MSDNSKRKRKYNMETKTTDELREILKNPAKAQQHAAALAELLDESREVTEEDTDDPNLLRGIRPTRRP